MPLHMPLTNWVVQYLSVASYFTHGLALAISDTQVINISLAGILFHHLSSVQFGPHLTSYFHTLTPNFDFIVFPELLA